ncbi:phosphatidylinositol glycan, class K [Cryptococcus neoformans]|nr:phosphatidylinositol glycan, class K [Cryptococcus neoformans var. grubii Bt1]OXG23742.1 phosphatidylinositol glycan, class K [Cryptococcus neoformans var. grubii Ze90-1]OXH31025.1 phosphatidylinositol glycan, class K [Cryptococcus neoformans var. grubii]
MRLPGILTAVSLLLAPLISALSHEQIDPQLSNLFGNDTTTDGHTNNWAVLVCSSRYWFNYRHMANTLAMYRTLKRLGLPDSNIILMLADDVACNARNAFPATVYANSGKMLDLYGEGIEVDYKGYEVTVESFLRLLTGRHDATVPRSKRLLSDASSNVFIYMTGHGGNEFLKFQDNEEVSAYDVADAIEQMWEKRRYNKLLYVIDTCQANTMYSKFYSPEIIATGSSSLGESSYSHHNDMDIGVAVIDSFTHNILQYLETVGKTSHNSLQEFFNTYDPAKILSHPGISTSLSSVPPEQILITDFFGAVARVEVSPQSAELPLESRLLASKDGWEPTNLGIHDGSLMEEIPDVLPRKMRGVKKGNGEWNRPLVDKTSEWGFLLPYLVGVVSFIWLYISLGDKEDKDDDEEGREEEL